MRPRSMNTSMNQLLVVLLLALPVTACTKAACPATTPAASTAAPSATGLAIKLTKVYVDDQDQALRFYTDVLGFTAKNDESNGGYRWLTVTASGDADGTELQLAPSSEPAGKAYQQAMFDAGQPAAMFYTADVDATFERMKAKGAEFTMPPTDVTFAKIAMVKDTVGNLIQITQLY
ncbi:MAG TPA: VOC family protein [Kofleriaceae bacterium]|nr:VOC family protein [Kofleriaceae bacterium]